MSKNVFIPKEELSKIVDILTDVAKKYPMPPPSKGNNPTDDEVEAFWGMTTLEEVVRSASRNISDFLSGRWKPNPAHRKEDETIEEWRLRQ